MCPTRLAVRSWSCHRGNCRPQGAAYVAASDSARWVRLNVRPTILLRPTTSLGILLYVSATAKRKPRSSNRSAKTAGTTLRENKKGSVTVVEAKGSRETGWRSEERTQFLIDTVGGVTKLAKTLGVSPSQPSRWKTGTETPSPEVAAKLLDLDHVIALAVQTWHPTVVMDWMTSSNGFLGGAEPIDVLLQRGSAEVIDALKATLSGAYV